MFRQRRKDNADEAKKFDNPLDELTYLLDELEKVVAKSKADYIESITPPSPDKKSRRSSVMDSLKNFRRKNSGADLDTNPGEKPPVTPSSGSVSTPRISVSETPESMPETPSMCETPKSGESLASPMSVTSSGGSGIDGEGAKFISMTPQQEAHVVELIRRLAELVVIGERAATTAQQHKDKLDRIKEKQKWGEDIMTEDEEATLAQGRDTDSDKFIAIFEHFFERSGLALITNILTGAAFDLTEYKERQRREATGSIASSEHSEDSEMNSEDHALRGIDFEKHNYMLLPPLAVATQAIQSVSILVQNVSRATSLFFILSNNHVNQLINFPLEQYHTAERKKHNQQSTRTPTRRFGSPELAELTTHFITFLKSLALRMNTETLQFFLTYPHGESGDYSDDSLFTHNNPQDMDEVDHDVPMDEIESNAKRFNRDRIGAPPVEVKKIKVEFPLYERALEFCAAHQDSFVRVTAMNICLNTLRLATVQPNDDADEPGAIIVQSATGSSPDGVLHNAKPLPIRERLAIAQYVCTPSRVELLISPIFTKLAQLWGMLEEQFRDMDDFENKNGDKEPEKFGRKKAMNDKVAKAKEIARRKKITEAFNSTAYNVQDELLLLDDVLKVGLTSLNEQTIEMMFATYVYPLLLQPLLLYFQRSPVPDEVLFYDPLNDHSAGREAKTSDFKTGDKSLISAPAKSAFFSLAAVFQLLTNAPLLRLLFTALFHPLAPHATGETMIRAKADVACVSRDGKVSVRVDPVDANGNIITSTDRSTYIFGTVTGKKYASGASEKNSEDEKDTCVFVLSPALSEILEFKGDDARLIARTRRNPYRHAIFRCFTLSSQLSDLRPLSVMVVDAAVSGFDEKFVSSILFGMDLKKFEDTVPLDERKAETLSDLDDRGIGGGASAASRMSLGDSNVGALWHDYMEDVISAFKSCLMKAVPTLDGSWKLEYDLVAAHALICAVRGNMKALRDAAIGVDRRCRQAAGFLSEIPVAVEKTMEKHDKESKKDESEESDETKDSEKRQFEIMDFLFRGHGLLEDTPAVYTDMVELKPAHRVDGKSGFSVKVSILGSYNLLCARCSAFAPIDNSAAEAALNNAMGSARAWAKLDALSTMMNSLVMTNGDTVSKKELGGLAAKRDGSFISTFDSASIFAPLSEHFLKALFEEGRDKDYFEARPGTVVSLVGQTALPCVCEVPPSSAPLFSEAGAKVVSQGITWQSLYLVLLGRNFVLAEPERRSSGDGRVVTCCKLERVSIEVDSTHVSNDTSARRLIVSHDGPELDPPGLFLFEETPAPKDEGVFNRLKLWRSSLDVWFEDSQAVELAQSKVSGKIEDAKVYRGKRLQRYLAQGDDSGYPIGISFGSSLGDTI